MFYRILFLLLSMVCVMFLISFLFIGSYISRSYERQAQESARQLLGTASEYVDLAVLDLGRAMQQLLWNTDITGAILVPDEVSYARKVEIVKALSTFQQDYPLVDRAYLLTYSNQALLRRFRDHSPYQGCSSACLSCRVQLPHPASRRRRRNLFHSCAHLRR